MNLNPFPLPSRWSRRATSVGTLALAIAVGAPVQGQRTEEVTRSFLRAPADTTLRRLQQRVDSLSHLFNDDEELSLDQRRRIGDELDRTVEALTHVSMRMMQSADRALRSGLAPMMSARTSAEMTRALTAHSPRSIVAPRGWLGIVVTGAAREPWVEDGELLIRYLTHPEIVSVEPSSPAERAGLLPSDTLLAYDGHDVRDRNISITRLLKPNARVLVRIKRDGRTRDVAVTIADVPSRIQLRPEYMAESMLPPLPGQLARAPEFPSPGLPLSPRPRSALSNVGARAPLPPLPARSVAPIPPAATIPYEVGITGVAGAQLSAITEGLGRTIGVRSGVLVTLAPHGSPAAQSGLRDGDVIVRADGEALHTVSQLRDLVRAAVDRGERGIELQIVRERAIRSLRLSWRDEDGEPR